jgi:hypothetical protein
MFSLVLLTFLSIDFAAVKAEPVLEKRAQRALDYAGEQITEARKHYDAGEDAAYTKALNQSAEGAEYALASLEEMGKHPSKNVRHYKPTEMRMRDLLRRLTTLRNDVSVELRPAVVDCERRVTAVHEKLLDGVMSKKPRS